MSKKKNIEKSYFDRVHAWGRVSSITALCVLIMFPLSICLYLGVWPSLSGVMSGLLKLIPLYWSLAVIEVLIYTPMLGAGGSYLSFLTGNVTNMKIPCAMNARDIAKTEVGTRRSISNTTNSIDITLFILCIIKIPPILIYFFYYE